MVVVVFGSHSLDEDVSCVSELHLFLIVRMEKKSSIPIFIPYRASLYCFKFELLIKY